MSGRRRTRAVLTGAVAATAVVVLLLRERRLRRCTLHPLLPDELHSLGEGSCLAARVFSGGGVSPSLRLKVWPLLLMVDAQLPRQLQKTQGEPSSELVEALRVIAVDVPRTRTHSPERLTHLLEDYARTHPSVLYSQGLSEIGAVFIDIFRDDNAASAAFAAFIHRQRRSFLADIKTGLLRRLLALGELLRVADTAVCARLRQLGALDCVWALRPVAVLLLRELGEADAATLWDVLMAHPDDDYLLYVVAAAVLSRRRSLLAAHCLDDLLVLVNSLSGTLSIGCLLADAHDLHSRLHATP